jgi:hypothetical protein
MLILLLAARFVGQVPPPCPIYVPIAVAAPPAPPVAPIYVPIAPRGGPAGDAARARQGPGADADLVRAVSGMAADLAAIEGRVGRMERAQGLGFRGRAPSGATPDDGRVPPPPRASPQVPPGATSGPPPSEGPPPPPDASRGDPGASPTRVRPSPRARASGGPPSRAMRAATAVLRDRCGSCHSGGSPGGGLVITSAEGRLARTDADFVRLLDRVAYSGYVARRDDATGRVEKIKMPPSGGGLTAEEYASIRALLAEVEEVELADGVAPR